MPPPASDDVEISCDYLVVGAGTSGMSFVDTLLTENATATVVLVDRNSRPGGHWNMAYPFVRLHQPSCFYGMNSLPLGKRRDRWGREVFDANDAATAAEIVAYYERGIERFRRSGRVTCFFRAEYKCARGAAGECSWHTIVSHDLKMTRVRCAKVVAVSSDVVVPSARDPLVPVHERVGFAPVNALPGAIAVGSHRNFVVLGAGKTGCDAIVELLSRGVDRSRIQWVISRDVWYFVRDEMYRNGNSFANTGRFMRCFLEETSVEDTFLAIEKLGFLARLDPDGAFPGVCKAPIVSLKEVEALRTVKNRVRLGRVLSIEADRVILERGILEFSASDTLFVDCMAEGFYGYGNFSEEFRVFEPGRINLGPLFIVNNPSFSSAMVAYVESNFFATSVEEELKKKNSVFFLLKGRYGLGTPATLLGGFYAQMKTVNALMSLHPRCIRFLLSSRTNPDSLNNRGGSVLSLLWAMFGPLQLDKKGKLFLKKIDDGGFSDIDHHFGVGRPIPTPKKSFLYLGIGVSVVAAVVGILCTSRQTASGSIRK